MAEEAYDRSSSCSFTSFVGYEHSGTPDSNAYHRNVIFRNDRVPFFAYFQLRGACRPPTLGRFDPRVPWKALRAATFWPYRTAPT